MSDTPHLYVTRAAALSYRHLSGGGFEAARRELTERILEEKTADVLLSHHKVRLDPIPGSVPSVAVTLQREGRLLVVPRVEAG